jgi:ribosome-associated protein
LNTEKILHELDFKAVRSSGAGGQNVNKVSSKVVLSFNMPASQSLTDDEKTLITKNIGSKLTTDGILILQCDEDRSQLRNKNIVTRRFLTLLQESLKEDKPRIATKIPRSVIKKRIQNKRNLSEKKQSRRKLDY